ncbi:serine-rich adhesin for platelets-like [Sycon ciliatum]|uniref:serine-rich adhesin for platelets-like n=1 Tax=Sycon ciliatum TaxID=27933 RepID=UPI0031F5F66C
MTTNGAPSGQIFAAECLKKRRVHESGEVQYLVKWRGYHDRFNTWEPEGNILDERLFAAFHRSQSNKDDPTGTRTAAAVAAATPAMARKKTSKEERMDPAASHASSLHKPRKGRNPKKFPLTTASKTDRRVTTESAEPQKEKKPTIAPVSASPTQQSQSTLTKAGRQAERSTSTPTSQNPKLAKKSSEMDTCTLLSTEGTSLCTTRALGQSSNSPHQTAASAKSAVSNSTQPMDIHVGSSLGVSSKSSPKPVRQPKRDTSPPSQADERPRKQLKPDPKAPTPSLMNSSNVVSAPGARAQPVSASPAQQSVCSKKSIPPSTGMDLSDEPPSTESPPSCPPLAHCSGRSSATLTGDTAVTASTQPVSATSTTTSSNGSISSIRVEESNSSIRSSIAGYIDSRRSTQNKPSHGITTASSSTSTNGSTPGSKKDSGSSSTNGSTPGSKKDSGSTSTNGSTPGSKKDSGSSSNVSTPSNKKDSGSSSNGSTPGSKKDSSSSKGSSSKGSSRGTSPLSHKETNHGHTVASPLSSCSVSHSLTMTGMSDHSGTRTAPANTRNAASSPAGTGVARNTSGTGTVTTSPTDNAKYAITKNPSSRNKRGASKQDLTVVGSHSNAVVAGSHGNYSSPPISARNTSSHAPNKPTATTSTSNCQRSFSTLSSKSSSLSTCSNASKAKGRSAPPAAAAAAAAATLSKTNALLVTTTYVTCPRTGVCVIVRESPVAEGFFKSLCK